MQVSVAPAVTLLAEQATETPEIVTEGLSAIVAEADLVLSCALVAVTVTEVPVIGAMSTPPEVTVPDELDQFTAEE